MWKNTIKEKMEALKNKEGPLTLKNMEEIEAAEEVLQRSGYFYEAVIEYMKKYNIKEVVDVGCSNGFQSEIFIEAGLSYIGVEKKPHLNKHRIGEVMYIQGVYPFTFGEHELGVFCNSFHHGFCPYKAIAMDFKTVITDKLINKSEAEKYFKISSSIIRVDNHSVPIHILTRK